MNPAFKRAALGVLNRLGQDAVLRGEIVDPPRKAHIAEDVEIIDREGNVAVASFLATLLKSAGAAKGDTLVHPDGSFVLEAPIDSNGASVRFTARKATVIAAAGQAPDTRPRYGAGAATAGVSSPAALLAAMTATGSNGSAVATFTVAPGAGQCGWFVCVASASASGVTFTDSLGTGGWQGASSSGNNSGDDGGSPNTSVVTFSDGTTNWRFFRQSYAAAGGTFTTS